GWGWRIPFLLSAVVIVAGYVIRQKVSEPPSFAAQQEAGVKQRFPFVELLRTKPIVMLLCIVMTLTNVIGTTTIVFGQSFATAKGYGVGFTSGDMLWVSLVANITAVIMIPIWGALSDKFGRRIFMIVGGLGGGLLSGVYLMFVQQRNLVMTFVMVIVVQGIFFQMWNATFATYFQEQFPMRIRVTGFAVSQNIGLMIASFLPSIFTALAPPGTANVPL
ncbi:MAG TPA: MFS transporter, partial [Propionibacteriaceae bacterium]|nr:MFS transporter [Propionibacteriaceae bacterium]